MITATLTLLLFTTLAAAHPRCRAIDGDTLACGASRVRIIGLDAPELRGRCPAETTLAHQAQARLDHLVAGGITIHPQRRDRYGRTLAVVRDARGRDVAAVLVREGLARPNHGERRMGWCR